MAKKLNITPAAASAAVRGDLENFMVAITPGGIEAQEAMGQAALVGTKNTLPIKCPKKELESLGFAFGNPVDDLFVNVTFPAGWKKEATEHSMWSHLLDDKGRKRGSIFYKAAFYDRSAHMHLERRYTVGTEYLTAEGKTHDWKSPIEPAKVRITVEDHSDNKSIYQSAPFARRDYAASDKAGKVAKEWLAVKFPDHENVLAYW